MNICLFSLDEIEKPLGLRDSRGEHIVKILHKKEGDCFAAGIIGGQAGQALITKIERWEEKSSDGRKTFENGNIHFTFTPLSDGKPLYPLKMIIGFPRPIQLKRLLRDMAGLGVEEVHLVITDLGEKSYLQSDLAQGNEAYKLLLEGTVQAAGTHVPGIFMHSTLDECIDKCFEKSDVNCNVKTAGGQGLFALDNVGADSSLIKKMNETEFSCAVAAIGSERGWSERERKLLESRGFTRCSMGSRVLRTETASTVAASLILGKLGYLG